MSTAPWTADRRVRRILASFATTPPPVERIPHHERWDREDTRYCGFRVQMLGVLKASHQTPRFKAAQAADDFDAMQEIAAEPSVGDAIDAALRIPVLRPIATRAVQLAPVAWLGEGRIAA